MAVGRLMEWRHLSLMYISESHQFFAAAISYHAEKSQSRQAVVNRSISSRLVLSLGHSVRPGPTQLNSAQLKKYYQIAATGSSL